MSYEIWLADYDGVLVKPLYDYTALDITLTVNGIGYATIELPGTAYNMVDFQHRYRLIIRRKGKTIGAAPHYITRRSLSLDESGQYIISVHAAHANKLLDDREIMYYAGSAEAKGVAEEADDLMKRLVDYNLGANAADADRDKAAPVSVVSVDGDTTEGPQLTKYFARRNLMTVLRELSEACRKAGTPLFFGMVDISGTGTATFKTSINQWASDNSASVVVSPDAGNLSDATRTINYDEFGSVAYALGQGTGAERVISSAEDTDATGTSDLLFIEQKTNANQTTTAAGLSDDADALLTASQVSSVFNGSIQETPSFLYGQHWEEGDKISALFNGEVITCWINKVLFRVRDGRENISAILEVV